MIRGRKPKPTKLRMIEGNREHRPINRNEPEPLIALELPPPPGFLADPVARTEWIRIAATLYPVGLLSEADVTVLAAYCQSYARWRRAEDALARMAADDLLTDALLVLATDGSVKQNPLVRTANTAMDAMVRYAHEFGMTPAARSRIDAGPRPAVDDMAKLFG